MGAVALGILYVMRVIEHATWRARRPATLTAVSAALCAAVICVSLSAPVGSAAPVDRAAQDAHAALLGHPLRWLLTDEAALDADVDPAVTKSVFEPLQRKEIEGRLKLAWRRLLHLAGRPDGDKSLTAGDIDDFWMLALNPDLKGVTQAETDALAEAALSFASAEGLTPDTQIVFSYISRGEPVKRLVALNQRLVDMSAEHDRLAEL